MICRGNVRLFGFVPKLPTAALLCVRQPSLSDYYLRIVAPWMPYAKSCASSLTYQTPEEAKPGKHHRGCPLTAFSFPPLTCPDIIKGLVASHLKALPVPGFGTPALVASRSWRDIINTHSLPSASRSCPGRSTLMGLLYAERLRGCRSSMMFALFHSQCPQILKCEQTLPLRSP